MTPFSLALGGPLYELYRRCRLVRPPIGLTRRRVMVLVGLTWLPLAGLSALDALALSGIEVPFDADIGVHVQFLLSLPCSQSFCHRQCCSPAGLPIGSGTKARNSWSSAWRLPA
jgi:hypothetical protein